MVTGTQVIMAAIREARYLRWLKDLQSSKVFDPNKLDEKGVSCLHHVAFCGYLSCLKWLVKKGGKLTTRSAEESVVAHYAAAGGHLDCLKWIHKQSAKCLKIKDKNGASPLYFAAQEGHLDCVMWIAKHSGPVHSDVSSDGMTAVHAAAQEGFVDCLGFLIGSVGCSGLARDRNGNTPMHFAAAAGHRSCVQWLLGHGWGLGQERNKAGSSPLHIAAEHGHTEVVKLLIKSGVSLDIQDRAGRSAVQVASDHGNEACAEILQQARRRQMGLQKPDPAQRTYKKVRFERKAIEKDDSLYSIDSATNVPPQTTNERVIFREGIKRPKSPTPQSWQQKGRHSRRARLEDLPVEISEVVLQEEKQFPFGSYKVLDQSQHMRTRDYIVPTFPASLRSGTSGNGGHKNSKYDTNGNAPPGMSNDRIHSYDVSVTHPGQQDQITEHDTHPRNIGQASDQNVFQKFYRFSKKKLARSSSFALQSDVYKPGRASFYVSGSESFILGARYSQTLALDGGDTMAGTYNAQPRFHGALNGPKALGTSLVDKRSKVSPTHLNQSTADKIRPDVTQDNALIW